VSNGPLTQERLILCESGADAGFLRALIAARGLPAFDVRTSYNPRRPDADGNGNTFFGETLVSLAVPLSVAPTKHIVVATDADDNPGATFQLIVDQIERAKTQEPSLSGLVAPNAPFAVSAGNPTLSVFLVPGVGKTGNLECMVYEASSAALTQNAVHVETLAASTGVNGWPSGKQGKMKLGALFGCSHRSAPDINVGRIWSRNAGHLVPLDHAAFDELAAFLGTLP